jgi:formate-dependent nitrite reductase membrane component NrfD
MDTTKSITLGQAFAHCASTGSYWLWIGIALAFIIGTSIGMFVYSKKTEINPIVKIALVFAMVAALFCSIFIRPCDVAQNTSQAAAARGHYLGY